MNDRWLNQFASKEHVNEDWYQSVIVPLIWDEWSATLQSLPNDKTCGPSMLYNEFYKRAGPSVQ